MILHEAKNYHRDSMEMLALTPLGAGDFIPDADGNDAEGDIYEAYPMPVFAFGDTDEEDDMEEDDFDDMEEEFDDDEDEDDDYNEDEDDDDDEEDFDDEEDYDDYDEDDDFEYDEE
jgi:hypothetical protein